MTSIGPFAASGIGRPSMTRALAESRSQLDELLVQLSSGKVSQSYAGLGDGARTSLAMRARLSAISSFEATAATVTPRIELMALSIQRLDDIGAQHKLTDPNEYLLTTGSVTIAQSQAAADLREAIAALNLDVGGRFLFGGRATDVKPVLSAEAMLADDGAKAGLRTVIAERKLADLGADGRGRIDVSAPAGGTFSASEEASGPFGFKIASLTSDMTNAVATGPSGSPASITLGLSGQPQAGGQIRVGLALPDGSTETIVLTAKAPGDATALGEGEFRIGADSAETAANMHASFDTALKARAATDLVGASAMQAGEEFFNVAPGAEPARVGGFDSSFATEADRVAALQSATSLDSTGTAAATVSWYVGETSADDPRKTAAATIDSGVGVAYGARASEDGPRRVVQTLAVFSSMTFSADDADGKARYAALASRVTSVLGAAETTTDLETMAVDLASASTAIEAAGKRHAVAKDMAADAISGVEDVSKEEVSLRILALQTQLQASYQVTANLSQLSLVNFL
jgi:flagellar hook-associated protein 3 FlgL